MTTFSTGHIGLNVTNLQRSKQFYQDVFGFELASESTEANRTFAFLANGGQTILTLWQQSNGRFPISTPGLHHLSFEVDHIDKVKMIENKLRELGTKLYHDGIVPHAEGASSGGVFFEDPDGIRLEVYAPQGADGQPAPSGDAPTCGFF